VLTEDKHAEFGGDLVGQRWDLSPADLIGEEEAEGERRAVQAEGDESALDPGADGGGGGEGEGQLGGDRLQCGGSGHGEDLARGGQFQDAELRGKADRGEQGRDVRLLLLEQRAVDGQELVYVLHLLEEETEGEGESAAVVALRVDHLLPEAAHSHRFASELVILLAEYHSKVHRAHLVLGVPLAEGGLRRGRRRRSRSRWRGGLAGGVGGAWGSGGGGGGGGGAGSGGRCLLRECHTLAIRRRFFFALCLRLLLRGLTTSKRTSMTTQQLES